MEDIIGVGTTKKFTQCPVCESTRRVANEVLEREKELGKQPEKVGTYLFNYQSIVAANMNWLSAPAIFSAFDVCADCGTVYCVQFEIKTVVQGGQNMPKAGGQFSLS